MATEGASTNPQIKPAYSEFGYATSKPAHTDSYLLPPITALCSKVGPGVRLLDVGCGNGTIAAYFLGLGCTVVGIDLSEEGIAIARAAYPAARFELLAADDRVMENLREPPFDIVISTEVVEHLYDPRAYARGCYAALKAGGRFICSTPYHGYLKNLIVALRGGWDVHADPLWDGGHIKLWSRKTLAALLTEAGFQHLQFRGAGRCPYLWKSMVMSGTKSPDNPCVSAGSTATPS